MLSQQDDEGPAQMGHNSGEARTRMLETEITNAVVAKRERDMAASAKAITDIDSKKHPEFREALMARAFLDGRLTNNHRAMLFFYSRFMNMDDGYTTLADANMAKLLGVTEKTIANLRSDLIEFTYLERADARRNEPDVPKKSVTLVPPPEMDWKALMASTKNVKAMLALKEKLEAMAVDLSRLHKKRPTSDASNSRQSGNYNSRQSGNSNTRQSGNCNPSIGEKEAANRGTAYNKDDPPISSPYSYPPSVRGEVGSVDAAGATSAQRADARDDTGPDRDPSSDKSSSESPPPSPSRADLLGDADPEALPDWIKHEGGGLTATVPWHYVKDGKPKSGVSELHLTKADIRGFRKSLETTEDEITAAVVEVFDTWRRKRFGGGGNLWKTNFAKDLGEAFKARVDSRNALKAAKAGADDAEIPAHSNAPLAAGDPASLRIRPPARLKLFGTGIGSPAWPKAYGTRASTETANDVLRKAWAMCEGSVDIGPSNFDRPSMQFEDRTEGWDDRLAQLVLRDAVKQAVEPVPKGLAAELAKLAPEVPLHCIEAAAVKAFSCPWETGIEWPAYDANKSPGRIAQALREAMPSMQARWHADRVALTRKGLFDPSKRELTVNQVGDLSGGIEDALNAAGLVTHNLRCEGWESPYGLSTICREASEADVDRAEDIIEFVTARMQALLDRRKPGARFVWEPSLPVPPLRFGQALPQERPRQLRQDEMGALFGFDGNGTSA